MNKFIERRKALGIRQGQLARVIGVSQARISAIETGRGRMGNALKIKWLNALGMDEKQDETRNTLIQSLNHNIKYLTDEQLACIEDIVKYLTRRK